MTGKIQQIKNTLKKKLTRKDETNKETKKQNKTTSKETRQVKECSTKKSEKLKLFIKKDRPKLKQNIILFALFCVAAVFMYWTNKVSVPENSTMVMYITISVMFNIFIIFLLIGTGIGIEVVARFMNKFKYKSGNYVNSLHMMKSGVIKERFVKKDVETGSFRMVNKPYITSPKLMFSFKGIQTYLHREGNPDPLDVWDEDLTGDLSNAEMDIAMHSKGAFDVKEWLEKNKSIIFLAGVVVVGVSVAAAFFGYSTYEMLRDGTFKQATSIACNNLPPPVQKIAETVIGGK